MKIDTRTDHGLVVWAKISAKSDSWAALVISTEILNLRFEESKNKTWVWWLEHNTFSHLKNDLIYDFCLDFKIHSKNLAGMRKMNVLQALEIITTRYCLEVPDILRTDAIIPWAAKNLQNLTKNKIGKTKRDGGYSIPLEIEQKIKSVHDKNRKQSSVGLNQNEVEIKAKDKSFNCIACNMSTDEKPKNHPIFNGSICGDCYVRARNLLTISAVDKCIDVCCICFKNSECSVNVVCCSYCIKVFGEECVKRFVGHLGLESIRRKKQWKCLACVDSPNTINRREIECQTMNIYNMYPASDASSAVNVVTKFEKIYLIPLNDSQNIVKTALDNLNFTYELPESIDNDVASNNSVYLLTQYLPIHKNYDSHCSQYGPMRDFFQFYLEMNKILDLKHSKQLFWIYEVNLSITRKEEAIISRFLKRDPILFGINVGDVFNNGRFMWTNICILNDDEDVKKLRRRNIFLQSHVVQDDEGTLKCHETMDVVLKSLIKNNA